MSLYADAGVDTNAGDRAVELMKRAVVSTHSPNVLGGVGGFAGMFDVSFLKDYARPVLATSTDGVGTKIEIARAIDKHDTVGQDLVAMVVDDIVVVGARPYFMTDYVACGKVEPTRIATIVGSIANACAMTGTSLVGGEVAEHPDVLGADEYDLAGAAVGAVDYELRKDPSLVRNGDVAIAFAASGFHSNGYSLIRKIVSDHHVDLHAQNDDFGRTFGEELLEPTQLYTSVVMSLLDDAEISNKVHMFSHITGGGIAANVARVLPKGLALDIDRATWSPAACFRVFTDMAGAKLQEVEGTWNLGIGMVALVAPEIAQQVIAKVASSGIDAWQVGEVATAPTDLGTYVQGAKGVDAGAVKLVGEYLK